MPNGVVTVVSQVLASTVAFLLGRFNFSLGWLLPFVVSSIRDYIQKKRDIQQAITHATSSMNERDVIFSRLDDIPAWVIFPDVERTEWINTILNILWPRISVMVSKLVKDLQPKINEHNFLKSFVIQTVNLGKIVTLHISKSSNSKLICELFFRLLESPASKFTTKTFSKMISSLI